MQSISTFSIVAATILFFMGFLACCYCVSNQYKKYKERLAARQDLESVGL